MVLVGLLVITAGCSALGTNDGTGASPAPEGTAEATPEVTEEATPEATTSDTESDGHSHEGDGHSHVDDDDQETTAEGEDNATSNGGDAVTGKVTVVVAGTELDLQSLDEDGDGFDIAVDDEHTWVVRDSEPTLTLTEALERVDLEADAETLTFDGETYRQETEGTDISYRVNGEPVDPGAHDVAEGDRIWVVVTTDDMNASTPGTYIDNRQQHVHGPMNMTVEGDAVDFGREKYQSNDRYFHFEGGTGDEWHAHSWSITLEYALSSLAGINASGDTLTYEETTYDPDDPDTTVTFEVNGESVEPDEYYLKDGDSIEVVVETEN